MQRTTLALDDRLLRRVREMAQREGRQLQDCVNELLQLGLAAKVNRPQVSEPLPVYRLGPPLIDIADRTALDDVMDDERP